MNFWTIQFRDYLEFDGVKEKLQEVKQVKKAESEKEHAQYGVLVEDAITRILSDSEDLTIKTLSPQMDLGFGADIQISYMENGKNYSFFADITSSQKDRIVYLNQKGDTTPNIEEAFCYRTEYFNIRFGLKERHMNYFFYEKPVVVLYVQNFVPCTGIAIHHIYNISSILKSLNSMLVDMAFGARASQKVRPNIVRFGLEHAKMVDTPEAWGHYVGNTLKGGDTK